MSPMARRKIRQDAGESISASQVTDAPKQNGRAVTMFFVEHFHGAALFSTAKARVLSGHAVFVKNGEDSHTHSHPKCINADVYNFATNNSTTPSRRAARILKKMAFFRT